MQYEIKEVYSGLPEGDVYVPGTALEGATLG
jgi:hypothetical protein